VSQRFGSARKARAAVRSGGGANGPIRRLKDGDKLVIRYLQNPDDWEMARYHYLDGTFVWCSQTKNCDGCAGGNKASRVILANALDIKENKVIIIQMSPTLADTMMRYFDKFDETLMDRDYELSREGSGQTDTRYFAFPEGGRKKRDLSDRELYDISAMIYADMGEEPPQDDEDEEPRSSKNSSRSDSSRKPSRHADEDDEYEDDDEEEEFEDDEEEDEEEDFSDLDRSELKSRIKEIDSDFVVKKSFTDDFLRETLIGLVSGDGVEDDEEEEDEPEPPKKPVPKQKRRDDEDEYRPAKKKSPVLRRPR
jgi:hypothetical protein